MNFHCSYRWFKGGLTTIDFCIPCFRWHLAVVLSPLVILLQWQESYDLSANRTMQDALNKFPILLKSQEASRSELPDIGGKCFRFIVIPIYRRANRFISTKTLRNPGKELGRHRLRYSAALAIPYGGAVGGMCGIWTSFLDFGPRWRTQAVLGEANKAVRPDEVFAAVSFCLLIWVYLHLTVNRIVFGEISVTIGFLFRFIFPPPPLYTHVTSRSTRARYVCRVVQIVVWMRHIGTIPCIYHGQPTILKISQNN